MNNLGHLTLPERCCPTKGRSKHCLPLSRPVQGGEAVGGEQERWQNNDTDGTACMFSLACCKDSVHYTCRVGARQWSWIGS